MQFLKKGTAAALITCLAVLALPLAEGAGPPNEYALKSVFLYNFCHFIEWPQSAFTGPDDPLVIGVVGEDPFGGLLNEAIQGEVVSQPSDQGGTLPQLERHPALSYPFRSPVRERSSRTNIGRAQLEQCRDRSVRPTTFLLAAA